MERDRIRAGVAAVVLGEEGHFPVSIDTVKGTCAPLCVRHCAGPWRVSFGLVLPPVLWCQHAHLTVKAAEDQRGDVVHPKLHSW